MTLMEMFLLSLSLSADSFVVSMSGSVTLGRVGPGRTFSTGALFGAVQALCLFVGWVSGYSVVSYIAAAAPYIALVILSYIGISMFVSGVRGREDSVNLCGMKSLVLAAVATSVDAIAVGVSLAMAEMIPGDAITVTLMTFAVTVAASSAGILIGSASGLKFGNIARMGGGLVLVFIGLRPFIL